VIFQSHLKHKNRYHPTPDVVIPHSPNNIIKSTWLKSVQSPQQQLTTKKFPTTRLTLNSASSAIQNLVDEIVLTQGILKLKKKKTQRIKFNVALHFLVMT